MRKLASASWHLHSTIQHRAPRQQPGTYLMALELRVQCQVRAVGELLQPKQPS